MTSHELARALLEMPDKDMVWVLTRTDNSSIAYDQVNSVKLDNDEDIVIDAYYKPLERP